MESKKVKTFLARVGLKPRGTYSDEIHYDYKDFINHNGSSFVILKKEGVIGITPVADSINYMSLAERGENLKFSDLTDEERDVLKLHLSDLSEEEIALLQEPAKEAVASANAATESANAATGKANDAAGLANTNAGKADAAALRATEAAEAAEGIVSDIRPDYNVDDKTKSTFIANRPEVPILTSKPTNTTRTYTNSYGNVVQFRVGDKVKVQTSEGFDYYTMIEHGIASNKWSQDWGDKVLSVTTKDFIEKGKTYSFTASADNSTVGRLVEAADNIAVLEALYSYGIEKDPSVKQTACTRIGNMDLHKSLPLQNKMRRCVLDPKRVGKLSPGSPKFIKNPNNSSTVVEKDGVYTIHQATPYGLPIIFENPIVGETYKFSVETSYTTSDQPTLSVSRTTNNGTKWFTMQGITGIKDVTLTITQDMVNEGCNIGIGLVNGGDIKPFKVLVFRETSPVAYYLNADNSGKQEEYERYNLAKNPNGQNDRVTIQETKNGINAINILQYHQNRPTVILPEAKVGKRMKFNISASSPYSQGSAIVSAKPAGGDHTEDSLIIIQRFAQGAWNGEVFSVDFVVTEEMMAEDRIIGIAITGVQTGISHSYYLTFENKASVLDGTDGDVMVELPDYYIKCEEDTKQRVRISERFIPGYTYVPKQYVGAFHGCERKSSPANSAVDGMYSVMNNTPEFRGGSKSTAQIAWDETPKSMLGRHATGGLGLLRIPTEARNTGGITGYGSFSEWAWVTLQWFCAIEYGTFSYCDDFNSELTPEGYKQGGIGAGVSTINVANARAFFNDGNNIWGIVPIGLTVSLGNKTGEVEYTLPEANLAPDGKVKANSYRGVEHLCTGGRVLTDNQAFIGINADTIQYKIFGKNIFGPKSGGGKHWIVSTNFEDGFGVIPKAIHSATENSLYTGAGQYLPVWSQAPTPTNIRVGSDQTVSAFKTLLDIEGGVSYDAGVYTNVAARITYTPKG